MQDVNPLLSTGGLDVGEISQTPKLGDVEVSPESEVDVTVVTASQFSNVVDNPVFNLSDCVEFLTSPSSTNPLCLSDAQSCTPGTPVPSPPTTFSTPSPSPSTTSDATPPQPSFLLDFDFTAISREDLVSVVNNTAPSSLASPTPPLALSGGPRKRGHPSSLSEPVAKSSRLQETATSLEVGELGGEDKKKLRRDKNNKASQVSRAKRKQRRKHMELRAEQLEKENEQLRIHVETLSTEIAKLRGLMLKRLTQ